MPILKTLLILLGTAAYLGLAVLGWGGFRAFFSHPALIALTIVLFALAGVSLFSGGNLSPGVREDRANRWVLLPFAVIGLLAAFCQHGLTAMTCGPLMVTPSVGSV
jgi:hypothetical protein